MRDEIFDVKTNIKKVIDLPYRDKIEELFKGLEGWFNNYDYYQEAIGLWQKTIYNLNIAKSDTYLWLCQSFELVCTLNKEIYKKAKFYMEQGQSYPNIKNFLCATNDIYKIWEGLNSKHYKTAKDVRDKVAHNNPKKVISDTQLENSLQLIELFLYKTFQNIKEIKGIPLSAMLKGEDK